MKIGKISIEELEESILPYLGFKDNNVKIWPGPGIDSGVVEIDDKYLVTSTDPITASSFLIGKWVAYITTNDVLASGGLPKWFLISLLLPSETNANDIRNIMKQLSDSLEKIKVSIIGGHTERTPYLNQPIAIGTAIGLAEKLFTPEKIKKGDKIFLAGNAAYEGIYIIYKSKEKELKNLLSKSEVRKIEEIPDKLSIYPFASKLLKQPLSSMIRWMHDPTEGGIYNGLFEISKASGKIIETNINDDIIEPIVRKICQKYDINPFKLLSSGSLLIVIDGEKERDFLEIIKKIRLNVTYVGEISEDGIGVNIKSKLNYNFEEPSIYEIWKIVN